MALNICKNKYNIKAHIDWQFYFNVREKGFAR